MLNNLPIFFTTESFKQWRKTQQESIGFVPTMGNLHAGHIALLEHALATYSTVVLSIFVNPTQFGPSEDFEKYPRTLDQDNQLVAELQKHYPHKKILIFAPKDPSEVYSKEFDNFISPGPLSLVLEGEKRPGHFQGVCSVVAILLNIVRPECLYLGKKDYQQLRILEKMIKNLHFPVKVIASETIRNAQGLALSSRNKYLNTEQLKVAANFPLALISLQLLLTDFWQRDRLWIEEKVQQIIQDFCQKNELNWDYCALKQQDLTTLHEHSLQVVLLGVIKINNVRLLDNLEFDLKHV